MVLPEQKQRMSVAEFETFTERPENADKTFEFIGGEVVEVPSNSFASKIAITIATYLRMYTMQNDIGHVTGEAGGYQVADERYAPDVAFISYERQPQLAQQGYNPNPPELAVEVVSSGTAKEERDLQIKLGNYLSVGTTVWVVRPQENDGQGMLDVFIPGQPVQTLGPDDMLTAEHILPGFRLNIAAIFR